MAIPIRLAVGPTGQDSIKLDAVSLDIAIDRNVSAFPTPNNILHRMAIDTNVPSVEIEIQGILQDDGISGKESTLESPSIADNGNQIWMHFGSIIPTDTNLHSGIDHGFGPFNNMAFEVKSGEGFEINANAITIDVVDQYFGSESQYPASEQDVVDTMVGGKLFDQYGRTVGTISGLIFDYNDEESDTLAGGMITDGPGIQRIAKITISAAAVAVDDGEMLYFGIVSALEDHYIGRSFAMYPDYWRTTTMGGTNSPAYSYQPTCMMFTFTSTASHLSGGSAHPTVNNGAYNLRHCRIHIPIGGVFSTPDNGNPAVTMAMLVQEALTLSSGTQVASDAWPVLPSNHPDGTDANYPNNAFEVIRSGSTLLIKQKFNINEYYVPDGQLGGHLPLPNTTGTIFFQPIGTYPASQGATGYWAAWEFTKISPSARWEWSRQENPFHGTGSKGTKSAGDKVQDLLGIISNASKYHDLIRGIQIPYDSLITSSGVTGTARNFFLTFGEQSLEDKGSLHNTRDASLSMVPSIIGSDIGGNPPQDSRDSWWERILGDDLGGAAESLVDFVGNAISDSMIALVSSPHGNDGGIRILPEKLHVRYDAGMNYYAFNLKLLASDFVIGV